MDPRKLNLKIFHGAFYKNVKMDAITYFDILQFLQLRTWYTSFLTPWSRVLIEKLTGSQPVKKFPAFMEPDGSLLHSQVPATFPYPEPGQPSPCHHIPLPEDPS
jgi:hypothetical protein